jgi:Tfp pilus assembly protein PilP
MKHGILVCTLAVGIAWAQSPTIIQNTRAQMNTVQQNKSAASNQALGIEQTPAKDTHAAAKPAATPVKSTAVKSTPAVVKTVSVSSKPSAAPAKTKVASAPATAKSAAATAPKPAAGATPKVGVKHVAVKKDAKPAAAQKKAAAPKSPMAAPAASSSAASSTEEAKASDDDSDKDKDKQDKKWSMAGKRDPFISPVVNHAGGSGCSTGKKCLEIGAINLRGVVHSDAGFIAVVTNSLNKAYFLRENDPVFDGYVVKITGDSIVFKETLQDRLGKSFTREVVKKITTPAV